VGTWDVAKTSQSSLAWSVHGGRRTYHGDKSPAVILAERGTGETYVHLSKAVEGSAIRFLLSDRFYESVPVNTATFELRSHWKRTTHPTGSTSSVTRMYTRNGRSHSDVRDLHVAVATVDLNRLRHLRKSSPYIRGSVQIMMKSEAVCFLSVYG
jgi:transposase-like protein